MPQVTLQVKLPLETVEGGVDLLLELIDGICPFLKVIRVMPQVTLQVKLPLETVEGGVDLLLELIDGICPFLKVIRVMPQVTLQVKLPLETVEGGVDLLLELTDGICPFLKVIRVMPQVTLQVKLPLETVEGGVDLLLELTDLTYPFLKVIRVMPQVILPVKLQPETVEGGVGNRPRSVSRLKNTSFPLKSRAMLPAIHLARLPLEVEQGHEVAAPLTKTLLLPPLKNLPRRSQPRSVSLSGVSLLKSRAMLLAIHLARLPLEGEGHEVAFLLTKTPLLPPLKKLPRRSQPRSVSRPKNTSFPLKSRAMLPAIHLARLPLEECHKNARSSPLRKKFLFRRRARLAPRLAPLLAPPRDLLPDPPRDLLPDLLPDLPLAPPAVLLLDPPRQLHNL
jgi:hypothetical protein